MYYINTFLLYSIIGHFLESFFYPNGSSGILYGWWTPIYGIGSLFIILIYTFLKRTKAFSRLRKWNQFILIFLIGAILLSMIEWIGGMIIELFFHTSFWNYSKLTFSIGKYISLETALIWGLASIVLIYIAKPVTDYLIKKIPVFLSVIFTVLFITDLILTFVFGAK